jgi:hypothetical protein
VALTTLICEVDWEPLMVAREVKLPLVEVRFCVPPSILIVDLLMVGVILVGVVFL